MSGPGSGSHSRLAALLDALASAPIQIFVYGTSDQLIDLPSRENVTLRPILRPNRALRRSMTSFTARVIARSDALDVLHFETLPVPRIRVQKTILSIHHLPTTSVHVSKTRLARLKALFRLGTLKRATHHLNGIVTLTAWSRQEILQVLGLAPEEVYAVPFSQMSGEMLPPRDLKQNSSKYVLILGHIEKRKNIETLIRAAAHPNWPQDVSLVVAGRDHGERRSLERLARNLGVGVCFKGPVGPEEKEILLSNAICLAMPSMLEGFGIPVAEAVNRGTPALVSDKGALPEVVGTMNGVIQAFDIAGWARKIHQLEFDLNIREDLLAEERRHLSKYSPELARNAYLQCLHK